MSPESVIHLNMGLRRSLYIVNSRWLFWLLHCVFHSPQVLWQWPFPTYRWEWNCHPSGPGVSPDQKGMGLGPHASPTPIPTCFVWHPPSPAVPSLTRNTGRTSRPQPAQATAPAPLPHGLLPTGHRPGQQRPRSRWVGGDPDPGVPAAQCQESPKLASEEEGGLGPALH